MTSLSTKQKRRLVEQREKRSRENIQELEQEIRLLNYKLEQAKEEQRYYKRQILSLRLKEIRLW